MPHPFLKSPSNPLVLTEPGTATQGSSREATANAVVIGDATNIGGNKYVLIERDNFFGPAAVIKRLYLVDLDVSNAAGILEERLLLDLLRISDPLDIGGELEGVSDPELFSFPFNSIESLVLLDESTLGVAIDNNYPGDAGRRAGTPDDIELIRIRSRRSRRLPERSREAPCATATNLEAAHARTWGGAASPNSGVAREQRLGHTAG